MNGGWMDGFGDTPPGPVRPPRAERLSFPDSAATPGSWSPGQTLRLIPALCCPACGAINVGAHDNGRSPEQVRWVCAACGVAYKLLASDVAEIVRCYARP